MGGVDNIQDNVRGFTEFGNDPQPVALRVAKNPYDKMEKKNFVDDVQWWNLGNLVPAPPDMGHDPHGSWMDALHYCEAPVFVALLQELG